MQAVKHLCSSYTRDLINGCKREKKPLMERNNTLVYEEEFFKPVLKFDLKCSLLDSVMRFTEKIHCHRMEWYHKSYSETEETNRYVR